MKYFLFIPIFIFFSVGSLEAQEHVNLKKGYGAEGYDVVAYFQDIAVKGDSKFSTTVDGVKYRFATAENLEAFQQNPSAYLPQYGGFCAYAIANSGKKVGVNPKTFLVSEGKLYLFYNSWGVNTLDKWKDEGADELRQKADLQWQALTTPE